MLAGHGLSVTFCRVTIISSNRGKIFLTRKIGLVQTSLIHFHEIKGNIIVEFFVCITVFKEVLIFDPFIERERRASTTVFHRCITWFATHCVAVGV